MVVEDDPSLRMLCRINLELDGYRVLEASSLAEAKQLLGAEAPNAMLLDVRLGDGDGREFLRGLQHGGGEVPPVAFFTGSDPVSPELRELAHDRVLAKPFTLAALADTVAQLVRDER
jgi:two-component system response regulator MprA